MVEGAALEMLYRGNSIEGSNPSLSASPVRKGRIFFAFFEAGKPVAALLGAGWTISRNDLKRSPGWPAVGGR